MDTFIVYFLAILYRYIKLWYWTVAYRGGLGFQNPLPPEILKISVESSIA